ncbi:MAG: hypothetical protein NC110_08530, partial [Ruminococcus sp.]|nr:hypothetical protein [Ruminococcus sp.]
FVGKYVDENKNEAGPLGLTYNFLYNSTSALLWVPKSYVADPDDPDKMILKTGIYDVSKNDFMLALGDINNYLKRLMDKMYGGDKLYTAQNAAAIINIVGKLITPGFKEIDAKDLNINFEVAGEKGFFNMIADRSGLARTIKYNWIGQAADFKPLMEVLGASFESIIIDREYQDADLMAELLLEGMANKILEKGPLEYFLSVFMKFAKLYQASYYQPLKNLFSSSISAGIISETELSNLQGLFNLISFNLTSRYDEDKDTKFFRFGTMPSYRFANVNDTAELLLYFTGYMSIMSKYEKNAPVVDYLRDMITNSTALEAADANAKERVEKIFNAFVCGEGTTDCVKLADVLFQENLQDTIDNTKDTLKNGWKTILLSYFQSIIKLFDRIYHSLLNFGKFAFDD